jgi:hypothetical protein
VEHAEAGTEEEISGFGPHDGIEEINPALVGSLGGFVVSHRAFRLAQVIETEAGAIEEIMVAG